MEDHLDPADLAARFRQALMPLVRQLRTNVEEGMTPSQMSALGTVAREGPITLGDLAAAERVTPPMATKLANALEEKGLVERLPCADDKRVVRLARRPGGPPPPRSLAPRRNAWLAQKVAALTDDERVALAEAVTVIERLNRTGGRRQMTRFKLATADTFRSLQHRNFRIFFITQGISFTGTWLQLAAQTLLVYRLTDSGTALGLLTAIQFTPTLLLGAWAGVVIDRHDKRRIMTVTSSAMLGAAALLALLVLTDRATVGVVYALAAVLGLANTFDNPARRTLVNDLVPAAERGQRHRPQLHAHHERQDHRPGHRRRR